jgi:hypothetical protein
MEVGDRIRIFEVIKSWYNLHENIIGIQRPELSNIGDSGVDIFLKDKSGVETLHFSINGKSNRTQAKHVATMVIKSIK